LHSTYRKFETNSNDFIPSPRHRRRLTLSWKKKITKTLTDLVLYIYLFFFQLCTMRWSPVNNGMYYAYRNLKNVFCLSAECSTPPGRSIVTRRVKMLIGFFPTATPYVTETRFWAYLFFSSSKRVDPCFEVVIKTLVDH